MIWKEKRTRYCIGLCFVSINLRTRGGKVGSRSRITMETWPSQSYFLGYQIHYVITNENLASGWKAFGVVPKLPKKCQGWQKMWMYDIKLDVNDLKFHLDKFYLSLKNVNSKCDVYFLKKIKELQFFWSSFKFCQGKPHFVCLWKRSSAASLSNPFWYDNKRLWDFMGCLFSEFV